MKTAVESIVRVFLALALCLAFIESHAARTDCGAKAEHHACVCCANPEAESCCAAPENDPAPPQPAAPAPRASHLDAILFSRPALLVLLANDAPTFPAPKAAHVARAGGHSIQSLLCVRTV